MIDFIKDCWWLIIIMAIGSFIVVYFSSEEKKSVKLKEKKMRKLNNISLNYAKNIIDRTGL